MNLSNVCLIYPSHHISDSISINNGKISWKRSQSKPFVRTTDFQKWRYHEKSLCQGKNEQVAFNFLMLFQGPMSEGICSWGDDVRTRGYPTKGILNVYEKWSKGGFGMSITGNIMINPVRFLTKPFIKEIWASALFGNARKWSDMQGKLVGRVGRIAEEMGRQFETSWMSCDSTNWTCNTYAPF